MKRDKRKMKEKTYRKYIVGIWVLTAALLAGTIGVIGWSIWGKYRDDIIQKQEEQMLIISDSLADNMEENMTGYALDLKYLCRLMMADTDENSVEEWRETMLNAYLENDNEYVKDLIYCDADGSILWKQSDYEPAEQFDTFDMDGGVQMTVVKADDGGIYFVLESRLENGQTMQMIIDMKQYYQKMISGIRLGTNGYVVLKSADGVVYMHPRDEQLGKTIIEGRKELYGDLDLDSLEQLLVEQREEESGIKEYYSYWWTDPDLPRVKKIAAHSHVNCGDGFIIVSIVMDYDDIYQPLTVAYGAITVTFAVVFAILLFFATVVVVQIVKRRRNEEEIEYLKDLNQVLEETKRGEEVITHQQRLQIMGTMTGGIAHEFNNLLTPIMGYSEMLLDALPPESEEADYAKEIFSASDKAKDIIKQIAGLSRKNMETVFTFVPLRKALHRAMKMVRSVCPANILLIEGNSFEDEGFWGNETQLNQVLLNICVNAFHAIGKEKNGVVSVHGEIVPREEVQRRHRAEISDMWEEFLGIYIEDNGCGMEPEILEQIFNPFYTTKVGGQGTGLGLSVAEQIVHSHQGYIFAESRVGVGSRFCIYLPKANPQETGVLEPQEAEDANMRILIVDDNGKVLKLLEKRFKKLGILVDTASNTEEAREALALEKYDVVLIDQELSRTSKEDTGVLFAMTIGLTYPDLIKIVMTDQVRKEIIEAKQHGYIDGYVEKPVSDARILEEIHKCLG